MILGADAEKPAEGDNGVCHLTGVFVDHQMMHGADLVAFAIVNRRAFNLFG